MTTVAVHLDDDLKRFVDDSIQQGTFLGTSELVAVALQNLRAEQAGQEAKLQALRRDIHTGIEQADKGQFVEFDAQSIIADAQRR
jgi:antitoxin ParD1/3/4